MNSRLPSEDKLDFFPTPPWATRAFVEEIFKPAGFNLGAVWEPACGAGDMARPLLEYTNQLDASDVVDRGYGRKADFLWPGSEPDFLVDWVITNPPFTLGTEFVERALRVAQVGVAMLARTNFYEGGDRFRRIFCDARRRPRKLSIYAPYVERVPMVKGRLDRKASTATAYAWFVWHHATIASDAETITRLIPPCRGRYERSRDYQ